MFFIKTYTYVEMLVGCVLALTKMFHSRNWLNGYYVCLKVMVIKK